MWKQFSPGWARRSVLVLSLFAAWAAADGARAQIGSGRYSSLVVEARTGRELSAVNADEPRYPASLTKMMTLYLTFEALRDHRITLGDLVPVSPHAASQMPSKLGLMPGTRLTVEQAILALVTKSANDAASALGELLGRDEAAFGEMMTSKARSLGMKHSVFRNASGLPDPDQITTARDMATLARRLVADFPEDYRYFSTPSFRFRNREIGNHDHMLETYPGADGLKTGFTTASGFNLVTSALRSNVRLVGVVLGAGRPTERDSQMRSLLDEGFAQMDVAPVTMVTKREPVGRFPLTQPHAAPAASSASIPIPPQPPRAAAKWSVQVGAFQQEASAREAAMSARKTAEVGQVRVEPTTVKGRTTWRAMLVGLSATEATVTCATLARHKTSCVILRPESGQIARLG